MRPSDVQDLEFHLKRKFNLLYISDKVTSSLLAFSPSLLLMDACRFFDVMYLYGFLALEFPWHDNLWSNFDFSELHFILFINKIVFIYIMLQGKQPCSLSGVQNARKILVIHNKPRLWAWPFIFGIIWMFFFCSNVVPIFPCQLFYVGKFKRAFQFFFLKGFPCFTCLQLSTLLLMDNFPFSFSVNFVGCYFLFSFYVISWVSYTLKVFAVCSLEFDCTWSAFGYTLQMSHFVLLIVNWENFLPFHYPAFL